MSQVLSETFVAHIYVEIETVSGDWTEIGSDTAFSKGDARARIAELTEDYRGDGHKYRIRTVVETKTEAVIAV